MATPIFEIQNLTKNCNESLILSILASGKKHGYQIALEIEERSSGLFRFNHGTLYPILHKLENDKLIDGLWEQEGPKRKRKHYTLTKAGAKYLNLQKESWTNFFTLFFEILGESSK